MPRVFSFSLRHHGNKSLSEAFVDQMCQDLASESDELIGHAKAALLRMQSYEGCLPLIQKSSRAPNDVNIKAELVTALTPNVNTTRTLYDLSIDIESIFSALVQLSSQKATKKAAGFLMEKIASLVEFAVCFDNIKTKKPEIQNDLSYFRRLTAVGAALTNQLERYWSCQCVSGRTNAECRLISLTIEWLGVFWRVAHSLADAPLNAMSFFVADHCPMLKVLIRAVKSAVAKEPAAVDVAALLANSRCSSVSGVRSKDSRPMLHYLRAMTGAIIIYDHTSPHGAFVSKSEVKIKRCVKELVHWHQPSHGATSELLATIKYCSLHFNDATTPDKIRTLMDK